MSFRTRERYTIHGVEFTIMSWGVVALIIDYLCKKQVSVYDSIGKLVGQCQLINTRCTKEMKSRISLPATGLYKLTVVGDRTASRDVHVTISR